MSTFATVRGSPNTAKIDRAEPTEEEGHTSQNNMHTHTHTTHPERERRRPVIFSVTGETVWSARDPK